MLITERVYYLAYCNLQHLISVTSQKSCFYLDHLLSLILPSQLVVSHGLLLPLQVRLGFGIILRTKMVGIL